MNCSAAEPRVKRRRKSVIIKRGLIFEMPNLNNVMLMGHLAREVDLRYTAQHKPVAEMTIAVNRRNGEREEVCFVDVVMWGKMAESCRRYLSKGSCVYVEGYLKQEHWEDR